MAGMHAEVRVSAAPGGAESWAAVEPKEYRAVRGSCTT
jgi:hypothetical protein